jgi:streptomycin 6-kinase
LIFSKSDHEYIRNLVNENYFKERVSSKFRRFISEIHGEEGEVWLSELPGIISACEQEWSLQASVPFENLSYNYIAPAVRADGSEVILKISIPNSELATEIEALRMFSGRGCVKLLGANPKLGALLLERIKPGQQLIDVNNDDKATRIAARVMKQLWRPVLDGYPFPTTDHWAQGLEKMRQRFGGGTGPLPTNLVEKAAALFKELHDSMETPVLLHGDLHHENILQAERSPWLAIDPKGVVGEPAYEVGALLRNIKPQLLDTAPPRQTTARRLDILADELGFDRDRMLGWGLAQAVLSACWCLESNLDCWEWAIYCAEQIDEILPQ